MPKITEPTPIVITYNGEEYVHNSRAVSKQQYQQAHERNQAEVKRLSKLVETHRERQQNAEEKIRAYESKGKPEKLLKAFDTADLLEELARRTKVDLHDDCGYCD